MTRSCPARQRRNPRRTLYARCRQSDARLLLAAGLAATLTQPEHAEDEGRRLAARRMPCHGQQGQTHTLGIPRIGGWDFHDLLANMARFRNGKRPRLVMSPLMQSLDEASMADVAGYFSGQGKSGFGAEPAVDSV